MTAFRRNVAPGTRRTHGSPGVAPLAPGRALGTSDLLGLFERSAAHYDRVDRTMSFGFGSRYRREALVRAGVRSGMRVLDVGCGTGLLACEAVRVVGERGSVTAVDPSEAMLQRARQRGLGAVRLGVAEHLPFPELSFDLVTMGYALRHVTDIDRAFAELHRVLTPGGKLLVLEQTLPSSWLGRILVRAYMGTIVPTVARIATRSRDAQQMMSYYWQTIESCVPPAAVVAALRRAGLDDVRRHVEKGTFSEYTARRPE